MAKTKPKKVGESPAADYTGWLNKGEVVERLQVSERSIDRMAERGEIQMGKRPVPGRRPMPIYNPADVERIQSSMAMQVLPAGDHQPMQVMTRERAAILKQMDQEHAYRNGEMVQGIGLSNSTYVQLEEAVQITGLPQSVLRQAVDDGKIIAVKAGRWYFQRKSLEAF